MSAPTPRTAVVLPVKSFARAKHRLSGALSGAGRRALMKAMLCDVLACLHASRGLHELILVTSEPLAAAAGTRAGARVVADPHERGHVEAAALGVAAAAAGGAERVLIVPGDCPLLSRSEVETLVSMPAAAQARMVIVTDRAGQGTNALLLEPPGAVEPAFGVGSLARHVAAARARGALVEQPAVPGLNLDVDTPADLSALRAALATRPSAAPRTSALLAGMAPALGVLTW